MSEFHPFTLAAAVDLLGTQYPTHDQLDALIFSWGCADLLEGATIKRKLLNLATVAAKNEIHVRTIEGNVSLSRAIVGVAIAGPEIKRRDPAWSQLVAGLRFDGFELVEVEVESNGPPSLFGKKMTRMKLARMLPDDIPELDFREAESQVIVLLKQHGFTVALGHLNQATSAFQRGEWSSANGELRNFFESYLNEIALRLGYSGTGDGFDKRRYLGNLSPPFLLSNYNEWNFDPKKQQYVQGLMTRMHPEGAHPGLSEEEDATFRLQISLITARLFLRRFNQRDRLI